MNWHIVNILRKPTQMGPDWAVAECGVYFMPKQRDTTAPTCVKCLSMVGATVARSATRHLSVGAAHTYQGRGISYVYEESKPKRPKVKRIVEKTFALPKEE